MTNIIETVVKAEVKAIRALDKAQGSVMDNLRKLVEHEQFSVAMVGSYIEAFTEAMVAIGYNKSDNSFKSMKSQRNKVLTFCAGGLDQQGDWTLEALESECERIMHEPNLSRAYKAVTDSLKAMKVEDEPSEPQGGEGESEGEGGENTKPTYDEMLNATIKLWDSFAARGATPAELMELSSSIHQTLVTIG